MTVYSRGERLLGVLHDEPQEVPVGTEIVLFDGFERTLLEDDYTKVSIKVLNPDQIERRVTRNNVSYLPDILTREQINLAALSTGLNWKGSSMKYFWDEALDSEDIAVQ